ncbi:FAD-dependent monooxygenase [Kitasatospora purpeofusca]|uniref:FAD-dependent monooxygenase n=1 Tax=Kitasatospora purpeofusca TaxID=67352 RepID=UPI00224D438A|nr:FAD-dependent monooxygenase [Kitasatospora purpeofusca]MCX4752385.1 FAD-dependent monooxygenase [Kitasatospora purpeofusca]WSR31961.1 FAD-dependent monooxygenase [Kitasatospora purpeofusca]
MTHAPTRTEVLVVGAGPTGLTLACDLARRGVPALLVEQAGALFPGSRGKGLQPRTQEVFEDLGLLTAVHAAGRPYPRMLSWEDGEPQGEWDLVGGPGPVAPDPTVPFPSVWMLPQWRTQELLHERLRELGGEVVLGTALSGLDQYPDRVEARLTGPDGTELTVSARYLVAADGGRSTVRRAVGIPMAGEQVDPRPALVADLEIDGLDRGNWHVWPKAPGGPLLLCPLPSTTAFQLFAQFGAEGGAEAGAEGGAGNDAEPDTSPEGVRRTVAARTHLPESALGRVHWASGFRPRTALAERFREGRVFLAGDAAHMHSPAGGQGLNTSIQDAYNLGWKLGQVLRHGADEALLDSYEEERLPIAADVLEISTRLHRAGGVRAGGLRRGPRTEQLGLGYEDGPLTVEARPGLAEDALRAGERAPDAPLDGAANATADSGPAGGTASGAASGTADSGPAGGTGSARRLFELFRGPHVTVLAVGRDLPELPAGVHGHRVDGGVTERVYGPGLFVVRPDGYLGLATHDPADLPGYLDRLGLR